MVRLAKSLVQSFCGTTAFGLLVAVTEKFPLAAKGSLSVLTYHRVDHVDARDDLDPSLISATPEQFARQMQWIARDFETVSLAELLAAVRDERRLPPRSVLVSFDDAYADFQQHAWPVLKSHRIPAALFVPTGFPDQPEVSFWWDRLYCALVNGSWTEKMKAEWAQGEEPDRSRRWAAFRRLKQELKNLPHEQMMGQVDRLLEQSGASRPRPAVLGWEALRELARDGVDLVPHSHGHPLLNRIEPEDAREEIRRSRTELESRVGDVSPAFAYPSGFYDETVTDLLRQERFELAFTTLRGSNDVRRQDPLRFRRINVGRQTPDSLVRLQIGPWARKWRPRTVDRFPG